MLLNDFFQISHLQDDGFEINATLIINEGHEIFEGHFPGHPVVPGVCTMQMIKEIIEKVIQRKINLIKAHDMKFLALIDPFQNNIIQASVKYSADTESHLTVTASLFKDEQVHFKFKGQFVFQ